MYTISNKSYAGEFSHFVGFYHNVEKSSVVCFWWQEWKQPFAYILELKMAFIKFVDKTFTVCWKSAKATKLFSRVTSVIYGICLFYPALAFCAWLYSNTWQLYYKYFVIIRFHVGGLLMLYEYCKELHWHISGWAWQGSDPPKCLPHPPLLDLHEYKNSSC